MKQIGLLSIVLSVILVLSCQSGPQPELAEPVLVVEPTAPLAVMPEQNAPVPAEAVVFDPLHISEEVHQKTLEELRVFIEGLNAIIRARNYEAWVTYLSESRYAEVNSEAFLAGITEDLFQRDQRMARDPRRVERRVLRNSRDFFYNLVVPSRSNDRLDDISFLAENRVRAYTIERGMRIILYDLQLIDNRWQIIN